MDTGLINKIVDIYNDNIEGGGITDQLIDANLSDYGLESLGFIRVIVALEEEFGIVIPDEYLMLPEMDTLFKIGQVVAGLLEKE